MYKHALTVVSKAAYKTLKRGASSFLGKPPQVSFFLHTQTEEACCIKTFSKMPGQLASMRGGGLQPCNANFKS